MTTAAVAFFEAGFKGPFWGGFSTRQLFTMEDINYNIIPIVEILSRKFFSLLVQIILIVNHNLRNKYSIINILGNCKKLMKMMILLAKRSTNE